MEGIDINDIKISQEYDLATHGDYHFFEFRKKFYLFGIENFQLIEIPLKLIKSSENQFEIIDDLIKELFSDEKNVNEIEPDQPLTYISLNVAQVCNLSCVYCYGVDGEYGLRGKMDEQTAFKSVDFLIKESRDRKKIGIGFFGGEPLLNYPLMKNVVKYAKEKAKINEKRITFSITTNGTKFTPEVNDYLNENNFSVIVSFDGNQEVQDKNRPFRGGQGSYQDTKPKIEEFLKSRNGRATGRATLTNHSDDLKSVKDELLKMGFNKAHASVATVSEFASDNRDIRKIQDDELRRILVDYSKEANEFMTNVKSRELSTDQLNGIFYQNIQQLKNKSKRYHFCGVGRSMVGIAINGDVYPCHRFVGEDKFKLGNVDKFDSKSRSKYSESYTQNHPVCSNCWARYFCGGAGCIQDNEVTKGSFDEINVNHCTKLKHQVKLSFDIFNNLNDNDKEYLFSLT